jgi:hypothetical protein
MTYIDATPPRAAASPDPRSAWDQCDHCQAPLDERQRYCVACGSRRAQADDPVARYFVAAARQARSSAAASPPAATPRPTSGIRTAIVLALIPLAAAIGVVVGRGGASDDDLLLQALKAQKAPVVNVSGGGGGGDSTAAGSSKAKDKGSKADAGSSDPADGKVISRTRYGTARQLTGAKPTPQQREESKKALDKIVNSKGKEYVESQRGLPDQIIVP